MRKAMLLSVWIAFAITLPDAHLLFNKNGSPVFELRNDGTAWFKAGYSENQNDAVEAGELSIKYNGASLLWTKSNGQAHLKNTLHQNAGFPGTGMKFSQGTQQNAELSTIGHCDLRSQQFKIWVQSIRFNYDVNGANHDALSIRKDYWDTVHSTEYSRNSWNDPAAYLANQQVGIMVQFGIQPSSITSATLQGISDDGGGVLGDALAQTINFTGGLSNEVLFSISGNTPNKIFKGQDYWSWNIVEGATNLFMERTGPHTLYTVLTMPVEPWTQINGDLQTPWVSALDFAIDPTKCNMQNATTAAAAATAAGTFLFYNYGLSYDPDGGCYYGTGGGYSYNLTDYLTKALGNFVNCWDQGQALKILITLIGGSAEYLYLEPIGYINTINLIGVGPCNNPFFASIDDPQAPPYNQPVVGQDDTNRTYFRDHAFVRLNGNIYDDCCGPYLGYGNTQTFLNATIDQSTPAEASKAGTVDDIQIFATKTFLQ